ncbi:7028_t:CDS:2, partial [Rhizophagus irregularis]
KLSQNVINIQNNDDWYFGWSILGALHHVKVHTERNPHRLYRGFMEEVNMEDIPIPIPVSIPVYKKFEENNSEISLYVYEWHNQNECLEFRYVSERRGDEYKQVNLLVISFLPGSKEVGLERINHYLAHIVDELLELWKGWRVPKTYQYTE